MPAPIVRESMTLMLPPTCPAANFAEEYVPEREELKTMQMISQPLATSEEKV